MVKSTCFGPTLCRTRRSIRSFREESVLVTTGRLVGGAALAAQDYAKHIGKLGETQFETWDKEDLVALISTSPEAGLAGATSAELLSIVGKIEESSITDSQLEEFSRRWFAPSGAPSVARSCLEASVIANRLRLRNRLDLATYIGLCLIRAGCLHVHGTDPPLESGIAAMDIGGQLFCQYAKDLFGQCGKDALDPQTFLGSHVEVPIMVTYPIRCLKIIEILGLLGLVEEGDRAKEIAQFLADFCRVHPGTQHPVSDHWAICLVAPALLLWKMGHVESVRALLRGVVTWIGDKYQNDSFGLASVWSTPEEETKRLLGNPFSHVDMARRCESYVSTIVLDLAAVLGLADVYLIARNDFLAVNTFPMVWEVPDTPSQFLRSGPDIRLEPNMPFKDTWEPQDGWKIAPHHVRGIDLRYLQRIGRQWDLLAVCSVLRDRHFVHVLRTLMENS